MKRALFVLLVALTFAGELVWSVAMGWPHGGWAQAWSGDGGAGGEGVAGNDAHAPDPELSWGRRDATLDAIIVSAVWHEPCATGRGGGCASPDIRRR